MMPKPPDASLKGPMMPRSMRDVRLSVGRVTPPAETGEAETCPACGASTCPTCGQIQRDTIAPEPPVEQPVEPPMADAQPPWRGR